MTQERRVSVWQLGLLTLQILSHGLWRHRNHFGQGGMVRGPVLWAGAATGGLCRYLVPRRQASATHRQPHFVPSRPMSSQHDPSTACGHIANLPISPLLHMERP